MKKAEMIKRLIQKQGYTKDMNRYRESGWNIIYCFNTSYDILRVESDFSDFILEIKSIIIRNRNNRKVEKIVF